MHFCLASATGKEEKPMDLAQATRMWWRLRKAPATPTQ